MSEWYKKIYSKGKKAFYSEVDENLLFKQKRFIITMNMETFYYVDKEIEFKNILLDECTTIVPDGIATILFSKHKKHHVQEKITGVDLSDYLLKECNQNNYKLALLGAKEEVLQQLIKRIKIEYPNIQLIKCQNGYQGNRDLFFEELINLKPDVCLVALGMPEQEKLIYKYIQKFEQGIFIGVGGTFDVLSGYKKRAPVMIQKLNIEWIYRIIQNPKRIKRLFRSFFALLKQMKDNNKA